MDSELEALDYDQMDHREVNARFVDDLTSLSADLTQGPRRRRGTAQIPIALCKRAPEAKVVAIDLAQHMLRLGSHNVERAGFAGVICLERRDAKALDLPDRASLRSCRTASCITFLRRSSVLARNGARACAFGLALRPRSSAAIG